MSGQGDIDPVTLEVIWSRFRDIPQEMGMHLRRTAFSPVIKYGEDFSTALFTWDGRLISQGVYTAGHLGSMPLSLPQILENHFPPETWEPGDVVITNDPYLNSGHLPDFFTFEPVFVEDELVGFCVTTGHQTDIGGSAPGSYTMEVIDMFAEGLQLPPTKVWSAGEPRTDIIEIILENSRVPRQLRGDLRAHRGASQVGVSQLVELVTEYGVDTYRQYVDELIERTETAMRESIRELPDETVSFTDYLDGFDEQLPVTATVNVEDDRILVDFEGTAPQQEGYAINCPQNYAYAFVLLAIKAAIDPDTPPGHGMTAPIDMTVPEGSIINPVPPAPVGSRQVLSDFVLSAVNGALAQIVPEHVPASGSQLYWEVMEFKNPGPRQQRIFQDGFYGGGGAAPDHDGEPAISGATNVQNVPVEALENDFPLRIQQYGLVEDTAGPGTYRGGNATVREYELQQPTSIQCVNERFRSGPPGVAGGDAGNAGEATLYHDGKRRSLESKEQFDAGAGDRLRIRTPAGGGHGLADERTREQVLADVKNELLSEERAAEVYGVATDEEGEL